jgi:hypothetical protein
MKTLGLAIATMLTIGLALPSAASEQRDISWGDLLPEKRLYHDPFKELEYSQLDDLAALFRVENNLTAEASADAGAKGLEIRSRLEAQGLDADRLFEQRIIVMNQRRLEATEPNPDLVGEVVRMAGYLLPLEMVDQKAVEFLLVPTVGACIHTPPPPANQTVLVKYSEGVEVTGLFNPVWISGEMRAQSSSSALSLVDGQADIEATYFIEALSVDAYE